MKKRYKIDREFVISKFGNRCAYCGCDLTLKTMQVDHVIPKAYFKQMALSGSRVPEWLLHLGEGDLNHPDNLHPSCRSCNFYKSTHSLETFRKEIEAQPKRLRERQFTYKLAERFGLVKQVKDKIRFYFEDFPPASAVENIIKKSY